MGRWLQEDSNQEVFKDLFKPNFILNKILLKYIFDNEIHGNVSIMNILINAAGVFKMADLGNARPIDISREGIDKLQPEERILNPAFVSVEYKD